MYFKKQVSFFTFNLYISLYTHYKKNYLFYGLNYETDQCLFVDSGNGSKKAFMFPKADMLGVFSELATADKEQTVANPIIIISKLDSPLSTILQFSLLM